MDSRPGKLNNLTAKKVPLPSLNVAIAILFDSCTGKGLKPLVDEEI